MLQNYAADIPAELVEADDILTRYGRWATSFGPSVRTCGSAEGDYRPGSGEAQEARRTPLALGLTLMQRSAAQLALARQDEPERSVLVVLYVPRGRGIEAELRKIKMKAEVCRGLHLSGLRKWWDTYCGFGELN